MKWVQIAKREDIPDNTGFAVEVEGQAIALYRINSEIYAIEGVCPHAGGPMAEGSLNGCLAMCPWHGWEFDVKTGQCDFNPDIQVKTYPVKEEKGTIFIKI